MENNGNMNRRVVLVVEDEFINRQILGMIVSEEYEVLYAENGRDALEIIQEKKNILSAILLDLFMPVMDGYELMDILQADDELKKIPIIVLTSEESAEVKTLKLGAADFIKKPYDMPEVILARVGRIIELSESTNIIQAAEKDDLTGLYTGAFFQEYAQQLMRYNPDLELDAVDLNIDHFRLVNEIYGRAFGDEVLRRIAREIQSFLEGTQGIGCRNDGDNFMICCAHREDYEPVLRKIQEGLEEMAPTQHIRLRMGVDPCFDREEELNHHFDRAKNACDTLRGNYAQSIALYDMDQHNKELFSERLINDIHKALEEGQFKVFYQPKYGILGERPVLHAAEALIRWQHPELGMVSPGAFIPLFENNGLIQLVDHYVWEQTAKQIRRWKDTYHFAPIISVNVSRIDIYDPNLEDRLMHLVEDNGLSPRDMHLEITESAYAEDAGKIVEIANSLRDKGFEIEMDDFGSGYSSLNMLTDLPFDVLKLDMKFIRNAHEGNKSAKMIELIMDIAKYLEVSTVAEGVETEEHVQLLKNVGCDLIQGYYFSKPVPAEEFEAFIKEEIAC